MPLLCVYPSEEDGCVQLLTYGMRKIIVRLEMVVFFRIFHAGGFDEINRR